MFEIFKVISLTMPLGLFMTFGLFVIVACTMKVKEFEIILRRLMFFYCLSGFISSILFFSYYYFPGIFRQFDVLYYLSVIFTMIVFHHFFRFAIGSEEYFNLMHYWVPVFTFIVLLAIKLLFPVFWLGEGVNLVFVLTLLWSIAYSLFPAIEMHKYSIKQVLISGTEDIINKHRSLLFISEVFLYPVTFIVFPLVAGPDPGIIWSVLLICCLFTVLRMNIPLTYAMVRHYTTSASNRSLFESTVVSDVFSARLDGEIQLSKDAGHNKRVYRKYAHKHRFSGQLIEIDKKKFDHYFRKDKPYLKPDLTINDLANQLQSNRTYVSTFINRVYGMNFNSYVNQCRLHELERLQALPANQSKSAAALIEQAGFGNYRSYLRAKKIWGIERQNLIL